MERHLWFAAARVGSAWLKDVRLRIRDGVIAAIEPDVLPSPSDERHDIAIPGLPNVHSHAFQRAMAGLTERAGASPDSFWSWRELMYRFLGRIGPDEMRAVAALAYMEMLEAGFTRVGEFHYLHHDRDGTPFGDPAEMAAAICSAASDTGIALTLLPVFYAHSGFGGLPPGDGQKRFVTSVDGFSALVEAARRHVSRLDDGVIGIAPHSLRAVTPDELAAITVAHDHGPVHIHVAEQQKEVEDCVAATGQRPVAWLLDHARLDDRWCLIHATHMDDAEVRGLAASGAVAGLCPVTEANLGDGVFPARAFLAQGGRFAVGSDSNVLIDAAGELRALEYSQRLTLQGRNCLAGPGSSTGQVLFDGALDGGARALGAEARLVLGAPADIVSLDASHPSLAARAGDEILDSYVFASSGQSVDCVWRRGVKHVAGGRHVARARIVGDYVRVLKALCA